MTLKIAIGFAVVGLLGVVVYAYTRQGTPTVTPTGATLPPVLTPATGAAAPRARSTGSGGTRDVVQVKGSSSGVPAGVTSTGSRQN